MLLLSNDCNNKTKTISLITALLKKKLGSKNSLTYLKFSFCYLI